MTNEIKIPQISFTTIPMKKIIILISIFVLHFGVMAQLDSCGIDYRPVDTLNNFEVAYVNANFQNLPVTINGGHKIAFSTGLGGGPLIETKREFFESIRKWGKEDLNAEFILLTEEEKVYSKGYDIVVIYYMKRFEEKQRTEVLEYLHDSEIHSEGQNYFPLQCSYIGVLRFIYDNFDTTTVDIIQDEKKVTVRLRGYDCLELNYYVDDIYEFDGSEICSKMTYESSCDQCSPIMKESVLSLLNWIQVDSNTYIYMYGMFHGKPANAKNYKTALIYRLEISQQDLYRMVVYKDEMDYTEYKKYKKGQRNNRRAEL